MDYIDKIIAYENGELSDVETVQLFKQLIIDGSAWTLQGGYGRMAQALIDNGFLNQSGAYGPAYFELVERDHSISDDN